MNSLRSLSISGIQLGETQLVHSASFVFEMSSTSTLITKVDVLRQSKNMRVSAHGTRVSNLMRDGAPFYEFDGWQYLASSATLAPMRLGELIS